ncbi:putative discoidin domain receptor [Fasciola gigantica]|uniref:Putative discoidin domain receptor n=1 Tax=Fasciola gigantica TaxID=46835 RepID=A0A504YMR1_FASGI|nr:putative discoidin domain receptor [Fasciola gigantica]
MRNGTKLLHANHNALTVATRLDPPIVAKRFRLYPYNELEPRLMCLRLAVYGEAFDDGVVEYTIPEGDVYRMDPRLHVPLNDSSYDGWWTNTPGSSDLATTWPGFKTLSNSADRRAYLHGGLGLLMDKQYYDGPLPEPEGSHNVVGWFRRQHSTPSGRVQLIFAFDQNLATTWPGFKTLSNSADRRAYLHGGLGLLMDKQYYDGPLPEPEGSHNVVGWFRRQHSTPSGRVQLIFAFDQIRNFTEARFHVLNSLNYVAVFQRALIQFSIGGQHFNRHNPPALLDVRRDIHNRQARWVTVPLEHRVGRFLRITLWFDYDWIVLSEVGFDSYPILEHTVPTEKASDPIRPIPGVDLTELNSEIGDISDTATRLAGPTEAIAQAVAGRSSSNIQPDEGKPAQTGSVEKDLQTTSDKMPVDLSSGLTPRARVSNIPYIVAIVCCCLGSIAFASLFVFMVYRLKRYRRKRAKKLRKAQPSSPMDGMKPPPVTTQHVPATAQTHQFLLTNSQNTGAPLFPVTCGNSMTISPSGTLASLYPNNSFQYNPLKGMGTTFGYQPGYKVTDNGNSFATLQSPNHSLNTPLMAPQTLSTLSPLLSEQLNSANYKPITAALDQESLFTLQLLQHASNPGSNLSSMGGLTLARRGMPDASAFVSYPLVTMPPAGMLNLVPPCSTSSTGAVTNTHTMATKMPFRPPPPPDQPLPPLPPPSTSPDGACQPPLPNSSTGATGGGQLIGTPVALYAASFPVENGLSASFDPSMPEYASASMFSGNGSVRQCSTLNSDITNDALKSRGNNGETYCIPHQNGLHQHFGLWTSTGSGFSTSYTGCLTSTANGHLPGLAKSGMNANNTSETFTGSSLDSSGLYYLANPPDSAQRNAPGLVTLAESQPLFLSTYGPQPGSLIPLNGMTTFLSNGGRTAVNDATFPYPTQTRHHLSDLSRTADIIPQNNGNPAEMPGSHHSPVLLPVSTSKNKSVTDPSS